MKRLFWGWTNFEKKGCYPKIHKCVWAPPEQVQLWGSLNRDPNAKLKSFTYFSWLFLEQVCQVCSNSNKRNKDPPSLFHDSTSVLGLVIRHIAFRTRFVLKWHILTLSTFLSLSHTPTKKGRSSVFRIRNRMGSVFNGLWDPFSKT